MICITAFLARMVSSRMHTCLGEFPYGSMIREDGVFLRYTDVKGRPILEKRCLGFCERIAVTG